MVCANQVAGAQRQLHLGGARFVAGLEQYIKQGKFFALQPFHLGAHAGAAHQLLDEPCSSRLMMAVRCFCMPGTGRIIPLSINWIHHDQSSVC